MSSQERIRLAEAMGWEFPHGITKHCPDPFTDANDDYAVLEWMRSIKTNNIYDNNWGQWSRFIMELANRKCAEKYEIGDYARAALKVLDLDLGGQGTP